MAASHPTKKSTTETKHASTDANASTPVSAPASAPVSSTPVVAPLSPAVVTQCVSLLAQVAALIGPVAALSGSQIRQSLKLRKGGLEATADILNLCNQHGITTLGPVDVATTSARLDRAKALDQIGAQLTTLTKQFSDATFTTQSATWQNATALYTVLQRLAVIDPAIANGLAPVESFFQTVRTKGKVRANKKARDLKAAQKLVAENLSASPPSAASADPAETSSAPPAATTAQIAPAAAASVPAAPVSNATNGATHS